MAGRLAGPGAPADLPRLTPAGCTSHLSDAAYRQPLGDGQHNETILRRAPPAQAGLYELIDNVAHVGVIRGAPGRAMAQTAPFCVAGLDQRLGWCRCVGRATEGQSGEAAVTGLQTVSSRSDWR
jgi:hypothetical protein